MGHSDIATTFEVYGYLFENDLHVGAKARR
jgi:hypothetical protein